MPRYVELGFVLLTAPLWVPVLVILMILVRIRHGSPVLFRQRRPGLHGAPFELIKLRTMRNALDGKGAPLPDAERLTRLGRLLRSTSLDELPELVNVLRGEMSLVGPRPLLTAYLPLYSDRHRRRHECRPGITGWAQINGRNTLDWPARFELDLWYVENRSFLLDVRILFLTVARVIARKDISAAGEATMTAFEGY